MDVGDTVPNFTAVDETGAQQSLAEMLDKGPLVVFFYPKAFTAGCTAESCHFRDIYSDITQAGGHAVGVSADSVDTQAKFTTKYGFPFPLLSDSSHEVARIFGIKRFGPLPAQRATFVIDQDHRVAAVVKSELNMNVHADEAIGALKTLAGKSSET